MKPSEEGDNVTRGQQFAHDLRAMREANGVSLKQIQTATRVPMDSLRAFEETALLESNMFNKVYLRSLVRAYASALSVGADPLLDALEAAAKGQYAGELGVQFLGRGAAPNALPETPSVVEDAPEADPPASPEASAAEGEDTRATAAPTAADVPPATAETTSPAEAAVPSAEDEQGDLFGTPNDAGEDTADASPRTIRRKSRKHRGSRRETNVIAEGSHTKQKVSHAISSMPQPIGDAYDPARKGGILLPRVIGQYLPWILITLIGGGMVLIVYFVWQRSEAPPPPPPTPVVVDTTAVAPAPPPRILVRDTMQVYLIAAGDKFDPVRVALDGDVRKPYWIAQGDSMLFRPVEQIAIYSSRLQALDLRIEGYAFPFADSSQAVTVSRTDVQGFLDTLRNP